MKDAGFKDYSKSTLLYLMIFISLCMVIATNVGMRISQTHGRRQMMLSCAIPMAVSQMILTLIVSYNTFQTDPGSFTGNLPSSFNLVT
jgi:uncharacterized membrane protein (DUF485 family)